MKLVPSTYDCPSMDVNQDVQCLCDSQIMTTSQQLTRALSAFEVVMLMLGCCLLTPGYSGSDNLCML